MNRIELAKSASTTKCGGKGCGKKVSQLVLREDDPFCSLACVHKSIGGSPWKEDDDYEDPTALPAPQPPSAHPSTPRKD